MAMRVRRVNLPLVAVPVVPRVIDEPLSIPPAVPSEIRASVGMNQCNWLYDDGP